MAVLPPEIPPPKLTPIGAAKDGACNDTVPPLALTVPVPRAVVLPAITVPELTLVPPA